MNGTRTVMAPKKLSVAERAVSRIGNCRLALAGGRMCGRF